MNLCDRTDAPRRSDSSALCAGGELGCGQATEPAQSHGSLVRGAEVETRTGDQNHCLDQPAVQ